MQGVGFRPFVYRIATELGSVGYVLNCPLGVIIEAESPRTTLDDFSRRLQVEKQPRSRSSGMEVSGRDPAGCSNFALRESEHN